LSPSKNDIDPRVLGQLLAAQSAFPAFSARQKMGEFVCRAVEGVPGLASSAACLPGAERPRLGGEPAPECADCDVSEGDVDHDPSHPCRLSSRAGIQVFPLRTQDRHFGFLLLKLEERERYAPYEPFVSNLANSLAVNIDRKWQKDRLEAANVELRRHREHLEELVRERTAELQLGLQREHHLNAVLRAIRNVNQLIVREKDRERLLQEACGILAETRGFRCVWIVRLGADGRVEAIAEAGIGPAFAGLRKQLERGELPECCRRALASEGPVALANPVVNCAACPLATEYRGTAGIAVPLRHEGRTYGVLIAALPAEMAGDVEELPLFQEVAGDIAFALHSIEVEEKRQRAEEELHFFALAVKSSSDAIGMSTPDAKHYYQNKAFDDLFGEIGENPPATLYVDEQVGREVFRTIMGGNQWTGEVKMRGKAGELLDVLLRAYAIKDDTGRILGLVGVHTDVTERKRAEEALRVKQWAIESAAAAIAMSDLKGNLNYVNPAFLKLWGYGSPAEVAGKAAVEFWQVGDRATEIIEKLRARGSWTGDMVAQRKNGNLFDVEVVASMVMDAAGQPIYMQAWFSDITERKRAEEAVRNSEARYRALFEHSADGILIADNETKVFKYANPAMCRMLGYTQDELKTLGVSNIHPKDDLPHVAAEFEAQTRGEKTLAADLPFLRKDGTIFHADVNATLVTLDGRPCLVGFFRDITERKRAEEERQQLLAQLLQAQKLESIGTLAGGVAHEINNPIMGIMNYAQLILDRLGPDSPVSEFATEIGKETERVATIVKNLLAFARHEKQSHSPARMRDIVEATLSLIRAVMRHDQVTLEVDVPEDLPQIKCRSQQIQQVIMNLLTNARDALNQRYPGHDANKKVIISARRIERDGRPWIRTTVEDHGPGIPEDLRERIFEPFFTTKPRDKGTGMGLSITHGIVKDHGGELRVESTVGEFTRFHIDLPLDNGWHLENAEG
jgi:PAS domain S-box-containing protein